MRKSLMSNLAVSALAAVQAVDDAIKSIPSFRIFGNPSRSVRKTSGIRKNVYGGQLYGIREANSRNGVGSGVRRKRDAALKAASEYYGHRLSGSERDYIISEFNKRQTKLRKTA